MRIEDVDSQRSSIGAAERQLADLALLGLDWDGDVLHQSERSDAYQHALTQLDVYECYCSRREIQDAARAPHVPPGSYPGTCRALDDATRAARRAELAQQGRVPALRLRAQVTQWTVRDSLAGVFTGEVDDFVLRRGGQQPDWAYNLAVVVDDAFQGVDQVVRGDDLLSSAPRQAYLAHLLRLPTPEYTHVPLVLNPAGQRLAKRDGAVTLQQMLIDAAPGEIVARLAGSLGLPKENSPEKLLKHFSLERLPRKPYIFT